MIELELMRQNDKEFGLGKRHFRGLLRDGDFSIARGQAEIGQSLVSNAVE